MKRIRPTHKGPAHERLEKTFDYAPRAPRRPAIDASAHRQSMIQRMRPLECTGRDLDVQTIHMFENEGEVVLAVVTDQGTTSVMLPVDRAEAIACQLIKVARAIKAMQD